MPDGTFNAVDITGEQDSIRRDEDTTTILTPQRIIRVTGIKNIDAIAIQAYDSVDLIDPFRLQDQRIPERTMSDLLDNAEAAGRLMAESEGDLGNAKTKQMMTIITVAAITAAVMSVMVYLKVG